MIYFTINAPDIVGEAHLDIKPSEISFSATAGEYAILPFPLQLPSFELMRPVDISPAKGVPEKSYAFDLQLYDEIVPEVCSRCLEAGIVVLTGFMWWGRRRSESRRPERSSSC